MSPDPRIHDPWLQSDAGPTNLEYRAQDLADLDPGCEITRTNEVIQVRLNGYEGIFVLVTPEAYESRLPTTELTHGTHGPAAATRLWRRMEGANLRTNKLRAAIEVAAAERRNEFRPSRFCGERVAIEHRLDDVCHGCASRHLGVVF